MCLIMYTKETEDHHVVPAKIHNITRKKEQTTNPN